MVTPSRSSHADLPSTQPAGHRPGGKRARRHELAAAGLARAAGPVALTGAGQARYREIRASLDEITARLFDFPAEDLATAGRVLSTVTARANAELG